MYLTASFITVGNTTVHRHCLARSTKAYTWWHGSSHCATVRTTRLEAVTVVYAMPQKRPLEVTMGAGRDVKQPRIAQVRHSMSQRSIPWHLQSVPYHVGGDASIRVQCPTSRAPDCPNTRQRPACRLWASPCRPHRPPPGRRSRAASCAGNPTRHAATISASGTPSICIQARLRPQLLVHAHAPLRIHVCITKDRSPPPYTGIWRASARNARSASTTPENDACITLRPSTGSEMK